MPPAPPNREPLDVLKDILSGAENRNELYQKIVNAPFIFRLETAQMFLGIIVLLIENKKLNTIDRIALSDTELARYTTSMSKVPFHEIQIPVSANENIIVQTLKKRSSHSTTDWKDLFEPALTAEQARLNQASGGIACSYVYPVSGGKTKGALIFSYYDYPQNIGNQQLSFMDLYSKEVSKALAKTDG